MTAPGQAERNSHSGLGNPLPADVFLTWMHRNVRPTDRGFLPQPPWWLEALSGLRERFLEVAAKRERVVKVAGDRVVLEVESMDGYPMAIRPITGEREVVVDTRVDAPRAGSPVYHVTAGPHGIKCGCADAGFTASKAAAVLRDAVAHLVEEGALPRGSRVDEERIHSFAACKHALLAARSLLAHGGLDRRGAESLASTLRTGVLLLFLRKALEEAKKAEREGRDKAARQARAAALMAVRRNLGLLLEKGIIKTPEPRGPTPPRGSRRPTSWAPRGGRGVHRGGRGTRR